MRNTSRRLQLPPIVLVAAIAFFASSRSSGQPACFVAGPTLTTTSLGPAAVAIGDLNGDGNNDVAVANGSPNAVNLYFGNGAGGFSAASPIGVGHDNSDVAIADFNEDGVLDLAVALFNNIPSGTDDLAILLGTGGGAFAAPVFYGLGTSTSRPSASIAVDDFNRDGNLDIAIGHTNINSVSIFLGNGAGSFSLSGTFFAFPQSLFSIATGDLNGDLNPDVVGTLDFTHSVAVLLGNGAGALSSPTLFPAPPLPIGVAVGDVNGDSRLDLAVANEAGSVVSILLGNGTGGFGAPTTFPLGASGSRDVVLADFSTDGRLDIALANEQSNNVSVLLGDGTGAFGAATNYAAGTFPRALAAGDLDGDGLPDVAVSNSGSNSVSILINAAPALPASLPGGTVNSNYSGPLAVSGGTAPFAFTSTGSLPAGLTLNPSTGMISGVPTQAGTTTFSITVTDAGGCSSTRSYLVTIGQSPTLVTLTSSPNPSVFGQTVRLTATVHPTGPAIPTGTVTFFEGAPIGTVALVNGVAILDVTGLTLGTHVFTAAYGGDANFFTSIVSTVLEQGVVAPEVPVLDAFGYVALGIALAAAALFVMRTRA
jgi:hypothetical protein